MNNDNLKRDIINVIMIIIGTIIMGLGFNMFLVPNNITPSGFSGLAAIISEFLSEINIVINPSIFYFALNIALYIFAYKLLGKKFAIMALIGIVSYSLTIELTSLIPWTFTEDLLVAALYGGIIFGVGTGFVLRNNGSTGGTDMLATIIRNQTHVLKTGQIIMICNIFVLALSVIAYGVNSLLYSIIAIFLASETTDIIIDGAKGVRAYYIITDKKEEVTAKIFAEIRRGATEIKSTGMYTHHDKSMILCLINKYRAPALRRIVADVDPNAFVFSTNVNEVIEKGFFVPTPKNKKKKASKKSNQLENNSNENIELKTEIIEDNEIKKTVEQQNKTSIEQENKTETNITENNNNEEQK